MKFSISAEGSSTAFSSLLNGKAGIGYVSLAFSHQPGTKTLPI